MFSITLKDITRNKPNNLAYLDINSEYKKRYLDILLHSHSHSFLRQDINWISYYHGGPDEGLIYATIENNGLPKSIYGISNVPEKSILEITGEYYYGTLYQY